MSPQLELSGYAETVTRMTLYIEVLKSRLAHALVALIILKEEIRVEQVWHGDRVEP